MPLDQGGELSGGGVDLRVLGDGEQAGVQLRDAHRLHVGQGAQHREGCQLPDGVLHQPPVVLAGDVVENHPGKPELGVEVLDPQGDRRRRLTHHRDVEHQGDGRAGHPRQLRGASGEGMDSAGAGVLGVKAMAVEDAGRALDDRHVGSAGAASQRPPHPALTQHPGVEVAAGPAADVGQVRAVDDVGPDLEGLDGASPQSQRSGQPHRDRGLAGTRADPGHHQAGHPRLVEHHPLQGSRRATGVTHTGPAGTPWGRRGRG